MKIEQEKIEELKEKYPKGIYEGSIVFTDEKGERHEIEFIYRQPVVADMEAFQKTAGKNMFAAQANLIQAVVVYPESHTVVDQLQGYPIAVGQFVDQAIGPFFGAGSDIKTTKL
jgi:hypothetical protein